MDLLEKLTDSFRKMNHDFFIIGENASPLGVKRTPGGLAFMVVQLNGLWLYNLMGYGCTTERSMVVQLKGVWLYN